MDFRDKMNQLASVDFRFIGAVESEEDLPKYPSLGDICIVKYEDGKEVNREYMFTNKWERLYTLKTLWDTGYHKD